MKVYGRRDSKRALCIHIGHGCRPFLLSGDYPKNHPVMFEALLEGWELQRKGERIQKKNISKDYKCLAGALGRGIALAELLALSRVDVDMMLETEKLEKDYNRVKELV